MKKTINISLFYSNTDKEAAEKYKKAIEVVKNALDNSNDYLGMAIETDLDNPQR